MINLDLNYMWVNNWSKVQRAIALHIAHLVHSALLEPPCLALHFTKFVKLQSTYTYDLGITFAMPEA
jgi:hypothetical protein